MGSNVVILMDNSSYSNTMDHKLFLEKRNKINKTVYKKIKYHGLLQHMPNKDSSPGGDKEPEDRGIQSA